MAVAWPTVKDRLVALLPTLPGFDGVKVLDGPLVGSSTPRAWVTVGWQPSTEDTSAGSFEESQTGPGGFTGSETGTVLLEFCATAGVNVPDVFALFDALRDAVRADQTLGVLTAASTASVSASVVQAQTRAGAEQRLLVSLDYFTRLT